MTELKFESEFSLGVTNRGGFELPLREGEKIVAEMELVPITPIPREIQAKIPNAIWTAILHPTGKFDPQTSELLMEVKSFDNPSSSYTLRWLEDNENVLYAVVTSEDENSNLSVLEGKVSMTLTVQEVKQIDYNTGSVPITWLAVLVPFGKKVNDFIISKIEIIE